MTAHRLMTKEWMVSGLRTSYSCCFRYLPLSMRSSGRGRPRLVIPAKRSPTGFMASVRKRFLGLSISITFGIWAYALVGAAAAVTSLVNLEQAPDRIKALSSVFVGYIL